MNIAVHIDKNGSVPVYLQIKEQLQEYITGSKLSGGTILPNVKVIAEKFGVSPRTADLALLELVKEGVCYRRPKKGTFVSEQEEMTVKPMCGIWSSYTSQSMRENMLISELYRGVSQVANARQINATLVFDDPEKTIRLYEGLKMFDFRGLLLLDIGNYGETLKLAAKFPDKKFIFLNYRLQGIAETPSNVYSIVNDDFGGAYRLAEHYIAGGCRKLLVMSWKLPQLEDLTYRERVRGYQQAALDYGLDFDPATDVIECTGKDSNQQSTVSYLETRKHLHNSNQPEAILATNDFMAEGVKRCLADEGLTGQIQLAGYDCLDHELAQKNGFSSVQVRYTEMGSQGIKLICSNRKDLSKIIKIEPQLYINKN